MRYRARFTANFGRNLDSIREFLTEQEAGMAFEELLVRLFDDIIPNLERFPRIGRDFLALEPFSDEGRARRDALKARAGDGTEIRECVSGDYLILYALRGTTIFLLAIRHHRQLSFDLRTHWP